MKLSYPLIDSETINTLRELGEDGNPNFLLEMIELFFQHALPLSKEVAQLLRGQNLSELKSKVHALKSQVANFGAAELAAACQSIEKEAAVGTFQPSEELAQQFTQAFSVMAQELEVIKQAELARAA